MTKDKHAAGGGALNAMRVLLFDLLARRTSPENMRQMLLEEASCKFPGLAQDDHRILVGAAIENFTDEVIANAIALRRDQAQGATILRFPSGSNTLASQVHS